MVWCVDDTKISHEDPKTVDRVIEQIEQTFGKMSVTRGKKHMFVGIGIEFNDNGTVTLSMDKFIDECINIYRDEIKKLASTPASGTLFDKVDENFEKALEAEANKFHHTTAKLKYLSKRV